MSVISVLLSYLCATQTLPQSISVEILLHPENVLPSSSVALPTLGSLSYFLSPLIWIVFPDPFLLSKTV